MSMSTVKRLAAGILKTGVRRIRVIPSEQKAAKEVLTRDDVRALIKSGSVYAEPKRGVSRLRGREKARQRALGRRRGPGSRKGKRYSKVSQKVQWMRRIRAQRALLLRLLEKGRIEGPTYRHTYYMIKGGAFRARATMLSHLEEAGLLKARPVKEVRKK